MLPQELSDDVLVPGDQRADDSSSYCCPDLRISASTRAAAALLHSAAMAQPGHPPGQSAAVDGTGRPLQQPQQHPQPPPNPQPASEQDLGCLVRVVFRWQHRPEWLREGAKLLVRDRGDGRVAGAGFVRRVLF